MSTKDGYEGKANAELFSIEYKPFEAKSGKKYETYKVVCILKEIWDSSLEEYVKYEDDGFESKSLNVFAEYTLWLGNQTSEKTGKTNTQQARELIQSVFDIEVTKPEDFFPNELTTKLKGKKLNVLCSIRDEHYTKVEFMNNINGGSKPLAKITETDKDALTSVLENSW